LTARQSLLSGKPRLSEDFESLISPLSNEPCCAAGPLQVTKSHLCMYASSAYSCLCIGDQTRDSLRRSFCCGYSSVKAHSSELLLKLWEQTAIGGRNKGKRVGFCAEKAGSHPMCLKTRQIRRVMSRVCALLELRALRNGARG
jgi:hypothetical protein